MSRKKTHDVYLYLINGNRWVIYGSKGKFWSRYTWRLIGVAAIVNRIKRYCHYLSETPLIFSISLKILRVFQLQQRSKGF